MSEKSQTSHTLRRLLLLPTVMLAATAAFAGPEAVPANPSANAEQPPKVQPFGAGFFPDAPTGFTIAPDAPVPESYRLGKGDKLRIRYWTPAIPEATQEIVINNDGILGIPDIGDIRADGLTRAELRGQVKKLLTEQFKNPSFSVDLLETRTVTIFVTGAARFPGRYAVKAESNLFNVIYGAGGPAPEGSMRRVTLLRRNKVAAVTDIYKFLAEGSHGTDIVLQDQDVIFFPTAGPRITIKGQVVRPAVYEIEDNSTVRDALTLTGGLRPSAHPRILRLERTEGGRMVEHTLSAADILKDKSHADNIMLRDGDVLYVEEVSNKVYQRVSIRGNVDYPGDYSTLRAPTVRALIEEARIKTGTFRDRADLTRILDDGTPVVVPIPLSRLLAGESPDIALLDQDEVIIYKTDEKTIVPLVTVEGAVKNPATFRKTDGMRASDLIFAAGGMLKDAAPNVAHIYRRTGANSHRLIRISPSKAAGTNSENPMLCDDDRLVIYKETDVDFKPDKVTIVGEVQRPGEYKACEGMSIYDLIIQAGGPTEMAAGTVEVATPVSDLESKMRANVTIYTLAEAIDGARRDEPVLPGMLLSIPRRENKLTTPMKVELKGQFKRPGVYALLYEGETLKSLMERAGGLSENADPFGISLSRKKDQLISAAAREQLGTVLSTMDQLLPPVSEKPNAMLLTASGVESLVAGTTDANLGMGDALLLVSPRRLKQMPANNRIAFSLEDKESYLKHIGSVRMWDGDVIEVPRQSEVVQVLGAVQSPGPIFYVPGYSTNDYIQRAGGGAPDADFNRAVVISISGDVKPLNRVSAVNPGDVIVMASQHQVIQPPRQRSLFDTITSLLGITWVFRGFK